MPTSPTYKFVPLLCALAMATVSPGGLTPARAQPAPIVGSPGGLTPARAQPATIVGQPAANPAANFSANAPQLQFPDRLLQSTLGRAYDGALDNLLRINTVSDVQNKFDPTGRMAAPRQFIRAGGGYDTPWTRDASLNSWNAASLLEPVVARNTLWAVCQQQPDGSLVLQRDNQWWDKVIWITAAWNHFKVTGDRQFLAAAYGVTKDELSLMRGEHFNEKYGLYQGPAFFADGIAGYPAPPYDPTNGSSFVLDHHYSAQLMTLSTNCVYYNAYRCAALMAAQLGAPSSEIRGYSAAAAALKTAINRHLWNAQNGTYAYFVHGAGPLAGQRDNTQEGIGLAYAILFGVADERQARRILQAFPRSPHGVTAQWPHFARFSDERPGRHNVVVWPNVSGMWACAAAQTGDVAMLRDEIENLALLALGDNARFHEIYNPLTGERDGGWQNGRHWDAVQDQTWSATAYLRMIYGGVFGLNFGPSELKLAPKLPASWSGVSLRGLRYRNTILDVTLQGAGTRIARVTLDGNTQKSAVIPAHLSGRHAVVVQMKQ